MSQVHLSPNAIEELQWWKENLRHSHATTFMIQNPTMTVSTKRIPDRLGST